MPLAFDAAILSRVRSPVTSRSNWATDRSTFSVSRPIEVVVLKASHLPFRRRERAMERFRRMKTLQTFAAVHGTVHNHFSQEPHLISRDLYRERRSAALAEWREVMG